MTLTLGQMQHEPPQSQLPSTTVLFWYGESHYYTFYLYRSQHLAIMKTPDYNEES